MKRFLDILGASLLLLVASPVVVLSWLGVFVFMGSPVFFQQLRPGCGGRSFEMFKFRTMRAQSPGREPLPDSQRLTKLGRFLRATSIDELPALINVLRGQMSLVGPRPLLQRYQPYFTIRERTRFTVRPGITGLAQIRGRNDRSWERRLSDDVEYVQRSGLLLDFFILARTVSVTVLGRGMVVDPTASALDLDAERCNDVQVKELGPESATEVAAVLSSSYERAWFPCSPVFEPGFPAVVEGWLGAGDCLLGVLHFGCLVAVAQIRSLPGRWHLNHFAVRPEHQGWGIAELLLSKIHDRFADRSISLHVDERNRRAFNFYFRQGYRATGCSIINTIQLPSQSGFCSARMLDGALEAELKVRGFCTLSIPGLAGSFTYLTGDRVYIGGELRKEDALVIGKWLGSGRIVIPETSRPIAWPVVDRWRVLSLVRDPETPRNKLEA